MKTPAEPMKIAVVSKANADGGGASRVAQELGRMLLDSDNVEVHHWKGHEGSPGDHGRLLFGGPWFGVFHHLCRWMSATAGLPDFLTPELPRLWLWKEIDYDLYHFHDISGTFSPIAMRWLAKRRPVVWTFHDQSPLTGGCLYPLGCEAYLTRCGSCPQLGPWPLETSIDFTGFMQSYKKRTARSGRIVPIAPSNWMAEEAVRSGMFPRRPEVIPYSVDTDFFLPLDKRVVREALGLPKDDFIVFMAAWSLQDPRKGSIYAMEALKSLGRPVTAVMVGRFDQTIRDWVSRLNAYLVDYLRDHKLVALYAASADVFLFPTLADNLPLSIMETMSAGTPVIAFDTGGVTDLITHGEDGWIVPQKDTAGLIDGLRLTYDRPEIRKQWAEKGRAKMIERFNRRLFLERHLELYRKVIEGTYPGYRSPYSGGSGNR